MKKKSIAALSGLILLGFGVTPQLEAQSFTVLHNFTNSPDGASPGALVLNGGTLIGTTASGGSAGNGSVFSCTTNGAEFAMLHNFTNTPDGAKPSDLVFNSNLLYGTTQFGGLYGWGAVFKVGINGTGYAVLHSFTNTLDGRYPLAGLATDGNALYGTTSQGGSSSNSGTVFRMDTQGGNFTILHVFTNMPDGATPFASLILSDSTLYGTTYNGGLYGLGTVFKLATNGSGYSVIYNFTSSPDGANPVGKLVIASNVLYGTSSQGGSFHAGTIFTLATNGTGYAILHNFTGPTLSQTNSDGGSPQAGLIFNGGQLYGDTSGGGSRNEGTVFQMNTNGTGFVVLKNFTNSTDGSIPLASLVLNDNTLFGSAYLGGNAGSGSGTLFSLRLSPVITGQPQSISVTSGNPANFSVNAGGQNPLAYQWYFNADLGNPNLLGSSLAGQTSSTLTFTAAINSGGYYSVIVNNAVGTVTSAPALLTVTTTIAKPTLTAQPQSLTVTNGDPANFTVTASGQTPLAYQWYFNANTGSPNLLGSSLAGQTSSTLTFTSAASSGGYYSVIVTNAGGAATSTPALLTVVTIIAKPSLTIPPQPLSVTNGFTATFTVTAAGQNPLAYQWYFNTNTLLAGQTGSTLSFTADTSKAGYYSVIVTNAGGAATSSAVLLTVLPAGLAQPTITAQPQSLTVTNGYPATFSVTATNGPLTYQWYFNTSSLLADQTNSSFTILIATANNAGTYTVAVANSAGVVFSSPALLMLITNTKPIIAGQPNNLIVTNGDTGTFSVTALGLNPLRYQWYSNSVSTAIGTLLIGMTNSAYLFTSTTNRDGRFYSVIITNTLGKATSSPAMLTVISKPLIITNPQPATVYLGNPATFSVSALGLNLRYQWYSNTVSTAIGTLLAGQTNTTYSFISITNANGRYYSVIVTNTFGRATSSPALLTVSSAPYITQQPLGATITNGDPISFTSAAAGPGVLGYQWLFQTNFLIAGATSTTLTFTNANQPGTYAMLVTNSFGAATSSVAQLTVVGRPIMLSAKFDAASGSYAFGYVNLAGSTNRLWASTNLADTNFWRALATNVMANNAPWFITDSNTAKTNKARFYRFSTP